MFPWPLEDAPLPDLLSAGGKGFKRLLEDPSKYAFAGQNFLKGSVIYDQALYRSKNIGALSPHPYAIADTAYRALLREKKSQSLVISGESGAGKTETAKLVMRYLANVSRSDESSGHKIQERFLNAQPVLESFGNAATLRNQNSSRFGKYNLESNRGAYSGSGPRNT